MQRFLAAARAGDPSAVACTPAEATASLATALACEQALTSGGRVGVDRRDVAARLGVTTRIVHWPDSRAVGYAALTPAPIGQLTPVPPRPQ